MDSFLLEKDQLDVCEGKRVYHSCFLGASCCPNNSEHKKEALRFVIDRNDRRRLDPEDTVQDAGLYIAYDIAVMVE